MTRQTDREPDTEPSRRKAHGIWWLLAIIVAMAIAAVAGVIITAHLTHPTATHATAHLGAREETLMKPSEAAKYREHVVARLDAWRRTAFLVRRDWYADGDLVNVTIERPFGSTAQP